MTPERRDAAIRHLEDTRRSRLYRLDHARKMHEMFPGGSRDELVYAAQEIDAYDDAIEALKVWKP